MSKRNRRATPSDPTVGAGGRWQFWIDRGGTFTDLVAIDPQGGLHTHKLLSVQADPQQDAAVLGMRQMLGLQAAQRLDASLVACVKMGTTVATNALLERRGEPTLLLTTRGLRDGLRIAQQHRPRLFDRRIVLPEALYGGVLEADERLGADGQVLQALDEARLLADLRAWWALGWRSVAIVFLHAYRHARHELLAERLARQAGFTQVSCSHRVSPLIKWVGRGDTTVVDAYLSPVLARYVARLSAELPGVPLYFMQSSGGLTPAGAFAGKDAVLSGPAGGIVGMARTAALAGHTRVIGFDMGGTSTDVSHCAGTFERRFDTTVAGVRLRAPMLAIDTVAAGGGSIVRFDGQRLHVGPHSAGADPGPACYRRGGPLTVTDANVVLGRVVVQHFPAVFGPDGRQRLDGQASRQGFAALGRRMRMAPEALAEGCVRLAVEQMAGAIKRVSLARGHDVSAYLLQCFGGAGGQHACQVAEALGMRRVLVHPLAGVLSAYGMGLADQVALREAPVGRALDAALLSGLQPLQRRLARRARAPLALDGWPTARVHCSTRLRLRQQGSDVPLELDWLPGDSAATLAQRFAQAYRQRYGFAMDDQALVVESLLVEALLPGAAPQEPTLQPATHPSPPGLGSTRLYAQGRWQTAQLVDRQVLRPGHRVNGPAVIVERLATTVVDLGWHAEVNAWGHLLLQCDRVATAPRARADAPDPVQLELFNHRFMAIAEQMGQQLQLTAHSVNIKERLDFSCALFDARGQLIANAPHMPVHLGSMGESIRCVIRSRRSSMRAGDVYALNDPYQGGTHLPDVTVVTPVFMRGSSAPVFFVASRGHHADIGGSTPGSMPPFSRHIDEEGVRLSDLHLVHGDGQGGGVLQEQTLMALLLGGPHPARHPAQNLADLKAQMAANAAGAQALARLVDEQGLRTVQAYMGHVLDGAEAALRQALRRLARWRRRGRWTQVLDNGAQISARIDIDAVRGAARIDLRGSSAQQPNNFNAPLAVCHAAVLYVFRTLLDEDLPLNAGCLRPLRIRVPAHSLLRPSPPAAVVAGNVETSTVLTNTLYAALGVLAGAQPTMNNLTFGDARHQYYETLAGGSGAGGVFDARGRLVDGFAGTACVQTHMTNSRLTDPEVIETRYPVRVETHALRAASGGAGRWRGGDGAVRRLRFLAPMTVSILSNGRLHPAPGVAGGGDGAPGQNWLIRADGTRLALGHLAQLNVQAGDAIEIQTPGGGGFGV